MVAPPVTETAPAPAAEKPAKKKKDPFLTTYVAVAVLAGLGSYAYFVESKKPAGGDVKEKEKVFTFDKTKVKEISLTGATETVKLVRQDKGWRLAAPVVADADTSEVDTVLSTLETLEVQDVVDETPAKPADFGLETPKVKALLTTDGVPKPLELWIGNKVKTDPNVYARTGDRPRIFTIPSHAEAPLSRRSFEYRDRSVLHVKRDDVKTLTITGPDGRPAWNDTSRPIAPDRKAIGAAIAVIDQTSRDQNDEATAGSSIRPSAISVPSAWKPATMFSTARPRNR